MVISVCHLLQLLLVYMDNGCGDGAQYIYWQSCQIDTVHNEQFTQVQHTLWCHVVRGWLPVSSSPYCISCMQWLLLCYVYTSGTLFEIVSYIHCN